MTKYCRKEPVLAMQWNGSNQKEFTDFVRKFTGKATSMPYVGYLAVAYYDKEKVLCRANVPVNGWAVSDGDSLRFFKDKTFRDTFTEYKDENVSKSDMPSKDVQERLEEAYKYVLDAMFGGCEELFGKKPNKDVVDAIKEAVEMHKDPFYVPANWDVCKDNDRKWREGLIKKYKEQAGKDVEFDTFDAVLDEMKELHAKKNADYGDAAHVNFLKYGPVASLSRLSEKMQRAEHIFLSGKCEVKDEPLTATLIDIAITSAMLYMELKNKDNDKH